MNLYHLCYIEQGGVLYWSSAVFVALGLRSLDMFTYVMNKN